MKHKPLIVSIEQPKFKNLPFPRVMWADVDPAMPKCAMVSLYYSKADQLMTRPDLKPIKVLVVALEEKFDQSAISEAIDVLNHCAEQGHKLS